MEFNIPPNCPVCHGEMLITSIKCKRCDTEIRGAFRSCDFCRLTADQADFVKTFLSARGSIKDVEKALGISYPTVRARIVDVLSALGLPGGDAEREQPDPASVIEKLESGEISPAEASELLKGKKQGKA